MKTASRWSLSTKQDGSRGAAGVESDGHQAKFTGMSYLRKAYMRIYILYNHTYTYIVYTHIFMFILYNYTYVYIYTYICIWSHVSNWGSLRASVFDDYIGYNRAFLSELLSQPFDLNRSNARLILDFCTAKRSNRARVGPTSYILVAHGILA